MYRLSQATRGITDIRERRSRASRPAANCHIDPHRGQFKESCTTCHTEQGWTGKQLVFSHEHDTRFPLHGKHAELQCQQCHKAADSEASLASASFSTLSTQCRQCHNDPHQGQFRQSCTTCHSEQGWKGQNLLFDHNRHTPFKIDAIHGGIACSRSSRAGRAPGLPPLRQAATVPHHDHARDEEQMQPALQPIRAMAGLNRRLSRAAVRSPTPAQYADACQSATRLSTGICSSTGDDARPQAHR